MRIGILSLIEFLKNKKSTNRFVLQTSRIIYDPTGILSPFTIRLKWFFFQDLWIRKLYRDTELPIDVYEKWTHWCLEL